MRRMLFSANFVERNSNEADRDALKILGFPELETVEIVQIVEIVKTYRSSGMLEFWNNRFRHNSLATTAG